MKLNEDGWYYYNTKSKEYEKFAPYINISKKIKNLADNKTTVVISDNKDVICTEDMAVLTSKRIEELASYGLPIHNGNKSKLSEALQERAFNMPATNVYTSVGLKKRSDNFVYHGATIISSNERDIGELSESSSYNLTAKGNIENWITMYKNQVQGNTQLEIAVLFGLSGFIFAYLKEHGIDLHNPIVHLYGESSTGKTTAAQLALSVAGSPVKGKGLFRTWNSTSNAIISALADNHGIPVLYDEVSSAGILNIMELVYTLAEGIERGRSDVTGQHREQRKWSTIILSTGEVGIDELNHSIKNTGVGVRLIQLKNTFTQSADQSENIKRTISQNYGHILDIVAKEVLETPIEDFIKFFKEERLKYISALDQTSELSERISNQYAALSVGALVFNSCFEDMTMDEENIFNFLVDYESTVSSKRDLADTAYHDLIQYLLSNQNKIVNKKSDYQHNTETIAFYESENDQHDIRMLKSSFEKFVKEYNYQGPQKIAKAMKEKGYFISKVTDRLAHQETVKSNDKSERVPFYTIKLNADYYEDFGLSSTPIPEKPFHSTFNISKPDDKKYFAVNHIEKELEDL